MLSLLRELHQQLRSVIRTFAGIGFTEKWHSLYPTQEGYGRTDALARMREVKAVVDKALGFFKTAQNDRVVLERLGSTLSLGAGEIVNLATADSDETDPLTDSVTVTANGSDGS